jgi:hypothetical protein
MNFKFEYQGTRQGCIVCGGTTEKFEPYAVSTEHRAIKICVQSLAEKDHIDERLEQHAARVEEWARDLRSLIGELHNAPTYAEWEAEHDYNEAAYGTALTRDQWDGWTAEQRQEWKDHGHEAGADNKPGARVLVPEIKREPVSDDWHIDF